MMVKSAAVMVPDDTLLPFVPEQTPSGERIISPPAIFEWSIFPKSRSWFFAIVRGITIVANALEDPLADWLLTVFVRLKAMANTRIAGLQVIVNM